MANENTTQASQQYNLRWNNHTNNILQVFAEHLNTESLVDVTISCQGKFIKAHKMVLSACSPYFQFAFEMWEADLQILPDLETDTQAYKIPWEDNSWKPIEKVKENFLAEELFKIHQVHHPVIIINGMSYLDIKLVIEFMYRGEIKVQENDLGGVLLAAETLQIKGLSNVRNKYEKGQIQKADAFDNLRQFDTKKHSSRKLLDEEDSTRKAEKDFDSQNMSSTSSQQEFDDDLPATIKVEPPDIRDIDEEPEPVAGWDSPRLIIDMKESKETMTDGKQIDNIERKRPNILRQAVASTIRLAPSQLELISEDKLITKRAEQETSTSAKCILWPKRPPSILGKWSRSKLCKIPRPPNAFMIFANDWRRKLALENPVESNKEISVRLGSMWKNLDADSKETYYSAARKADEEHKLKYPGYYYSPKEARMRKGLKRRAMTAAASAPVDTLRFVKVYMTSAEKASLKLETKTSLFRELLPKPAPAEVMDTSGQVNSTVATGVMENGTKANADKQDTEMDTDALLEVS